MLEGLRRGQSIAELCREEGIDQNLYYRSSLAGDTVREASSDQVDSLKAESSQPKELLAELTTENRLLKTDVGEDAT